MKKILNLLLISICTSFITMNETSCFCNRNKEKTYDSVANKISAAQNICLRDDSDDASVTKETDKTAILNQIGLTSQEQKYVIDLSGTLVVNSTSTISFNITKSISSTVVYKTVTNDVVWQKINALNADLNSNIDNLKNLALINNQQLAISGNSPNYLSDKNLDFSVNKTLPTSCASGKLSWINSINHKEYGAQLSCGTDYLYGCKLEPDASNNYYPGAPFRIKFTNALDVEIISISNNKLYATTDYKNQWVINDDDTATQLTIAAPLLNSSNCIWNANGTLYIGTKQSLYSSTDNGNNWTKIPDINNLDILGIISSIDGSQVFFITTTDLYESTNGATFESIYHTKDTKINPYSLFISKNNNLYFGDNNQGLWTMPLSNLSAQQIISEHIGATDDIKNITQTADGTILILSNKNVAYLQD